MKKRNKPILLATILIVFIGGAVAMNAAMLPKSEAEQAQEQQQQATDDKPLEAPHNDTSAKEAADETAQQMMKAPANKMLPEDMQKKMPGYSILKNHNGGPAKPQPNASMTSAHWYDKEYGYKGGDK